MLSLLLLSFAFVLRFYCCLCLCSIFAGSYVSKEQAAKKVEKDKKRQDQMAKKAEAAVKKAAEDKERMEMEAKAHAIEMAKKAEMEVEEEDQAEPNKLLFLENLPVQCNKMMLEMLFQQYVHENSPTSCFAPCILLL